MALAHATPASRMIVLDGAWDATERVHVADALKDMNWIRATSLYRGWGQTPVSKIHVRLGEAFNSSFEMQDGAREYHITLARGASVRDMAFYLSQTIPARFRAPKPCASFLRFPVFRTMAQST